MTEPQSAPPLSAAEALAAVAGWPKSMSRFGLHRIAEALAAEVLHLVEIEAHREEWMERRTGRLLWAMNRRVERVEHLTQQLLRGQAKIMQTTADILTAEQAQGEKIDKLVALTDEIFAKLSTSPPSEDPNVQAVLDMIAAHNASMDATIARDTPADPAADRAAPPA